MTCPDCEASARTVERLTKALAADLDRLRQLVNEKKELLDFKEKGGRRSFDAPLTCVHGREGGVFCPHCNDGGGERSDAPPVAVSEGGRVQAIPSDFEACMWEEATKGPNSQRLGISAQFGVNFWHEISTNVTWLRPALPDAEKLARAIWIELAAGTAGRDADQFAECVRRALGLEAKP